MCTKRITRRINFQDMEDTSALNVEASVECYCNLVAESLRRRFPHYEVDVQPGEYEVSIICDSFEEHCDVWAVVDQIESSVFKEGDWAVGIITSND